MRITREQAEHVARLARLELSPEEQRTFVEQLDKILTYMDQLNELDTDDVAWAFHTWGMQNVLRDDVQGESLPREEALSNAPERTTEAYKVPRVIE